MTWTSSHFKEIACFSCNPYCPFIFLNTTLYFISPIIILFNCPVVFVYLPTLFLFSTTNMVNFFLSPYFPTVLCLCLVTAAITLAAGIVIWLILTIVHRFNQAKNSIYLPFGSSSLLSHYICSISCLEAFRPCLLSMFKFHQSRISPSFFTVSIKKVLIKNRGWCNLLNSPLNLLGLCYTLKILCT